MTDLEQQARHDRDMTVGRLEGRVAALEERVNRRETADDQRWKDLIALVSDVRDSVTGWKAQERLVLLAGGWGMGAIMAWIGHVVLGK
jgi:hypothetical protein